MDIIEFSIEQTKVLSYLKNIKTTTPIYYSKLMIYGTNPNDLIKWIQNPEKCVRWDEEYKLKIINAFWNIHDYCILPFPEIKEQNEEDRVLSRLFKKNSDLPLGTNLFFGEKIKMEHIILFMERDISIYSWNSDFVISVQYEVNRVKEHLLNYES